MSENDKTAIADLRNVKVKALRAHQNGHGGKFEKGQGDIYIHPRPAADIVAGLVEVSEEGAETAPKSSKGKTAES